jgi:hypothetical protein
MTDSRPSGSEQTPDGAESGTNAPEANGVNRRTIVQGAAWSIPVVAAALGAPLAAASTAPTPTLTFNGPYGIYACGTITGAWLRATIDGTTPHASHVVTVTLPDGITFSDGTSTKPFTTDDYGFIAFPEIKAGDSPLTGSISARDGTSSAVATVTVTPKTVAFGAIQSDTPSAYSASIPLDATAVTLGFFLTPNGDLYFANGKLVATGVTSVGSQSIQSMGDMVTYTTATGAFEGQDNRSSHALPASIPAGSNAVGFRYFLAPNGDLYYADGKRVARGVTSARSQYLLGEGDIVTYVTASGVFEANGSGASHRYPSSIPASSTAVGFRYFLAPDRDLYYSNGKRVATGVTSVAGQHIDDRGDVVTYVTADGAFQAQGSGVSSALPTSIPADSTAVCFRYFLAPNGDLYYAGGNRVDTGVTSAASQFISFSWDRVTYTKSSCA